MQKKPITRVERHDRAGDAPERRSFMILINLEKGRNANANILSFGTG